MSGFQSYRLTKMSMTILMYLERAMSSSPDLAGISEQFVKNPARRKFSLEGYQMQLWMPWDLIVAQKLNCLKIEWKS